MRLAVADRDVGGARDQGLHEVGDLRLRILVVAVGVDDDVGAVTERVVHAVAERAGEPLVAHVVHEVGDAVRLRDLDGAVARAVVDDEDMDLVDTGDRLRDALENERKGLLLVEARHLDEDLHKSLSFCDLLRGV